MRFNGKHRQFRELITWVRSLREEPSEVLAFGSVVLAMFRADDGEVRRVELRQQLFADRADIDRAHAALRLYAPPIANAVPEDYRFKGRHHIAAWHWN